MCKMLFRKDLSKCTHAGAPTHTSTLYEIYKRLKQIEWRFTAEEDSSARGENIAGL